MAPEDPLSGARGFLVGFSVGLVFWTALIGLLLLTCIL